MENHEEHQINYWAGKDTYDFDSPKPTRSLKKKLFIVFSFILILAITPTLIYGLINLDLTNNTNLASSKSEPLQENTKLPEVYKVTIEEPSVKSNQAIVINNDSYWKISKRICDEGKYYLSIRDQNKAKALFEGDTITVNCSL